MVTQNNKPVREIWRQVKVRKDPVPYPPAPVPPQGLFWIPDLHNTDKALSWPHFRMTPLMLRKVSGRALLRILDTWQLVLTVNTFGGITSVPHLGLQSTSLEKQRVVPCGMASSESGVPISFLLLYAHEENILLHFKLRFRYRLCGVSDKTFFPMPVGHAEMVQQIQHADSSTDTRSLIWLRGNLTLTSPLF